MTLLLLLACAPEAPDSVEEMLVYGFQHQGDEDPDALVALGEKLVPWLEDHFEEAHGGYGINRLQGEDLALAGVNQALSEDGIVGAVVGVDYALSVDALAEALTWPQQEEIFTGYLGYEVIEEHDRACFLTGACEWFDVEETVHADLGVLGIESWHTGTSSTRWVTLSDGRRALVHRGLGPDPVEFSVDFLAVTQQYTFTFGYERDDGSVRRAQAVWAEGEVIGADLPEDFQINTAVSTMISAAGELEAWVLERE